MNPINRKCKTCQKDHNNESIFCSEECFDEWLFLALAMDIINLLRAVREHDADSK